MKIRGALIQGALAVVGLGAAYATWQRPPEQEQGAVVVIDATRNELRAVRFDDGKAWAELRQHGEEDGQPAIWVHLSAREQPAAKVQTPERTVRGNDGARKLYAAFAPLRASRALGIIEAGKLAEYGLAAPPASDGGAPPAYTPRTLTVTVRDQTRHFRVGTPKGSFATYLRDEDDGRVYLLGSELRLADLESAPTRLVDRTLHALKPGDYDAITVEAGGKRRELVVIGGAQPFADKLADRRTPSQADATAKNWTDRVWRLYPAEVLGQGEWPEPGAPQPEIKLEYLAKGKSVGFVELAHASSSPPVPPAMSLGGDPAKTPPAKPAVAETRYYARTEHTAGWVRLSPAAAELYKEAASIAAAEK